MSLPSGRTWTIDDPNGLAPLLPEFLSAVMPVIERRAGAPLADRQLVVEVGTTDDRLGAMGLFESGTTSRLQLFRYGDQEIDRQTVAHELGHFLLYLIGEEWLDGRASMVVGEYLADRIGADLLRPLERPRGLRRLGRDYVARSAYDECSFWQFIERKRSRAGAPEADPRDFKRVENSLARILLLRAYELGAEHGFGVREPAGMRQRGASRRDRAALATALRPLALAGRALPHDPSAPALDEFSSALPVELVPRIDAFMRYCDLYGPNEIDTGGIL
jgi:hypothetical protein